MEVQVKNPELEKQLNELAQLSGRDANELVEDALAGYLEELGTPRSRLDSRYDDLKSGRVRPIDGEDAFARLKAKSEERRNGSA